MKKDIPGNASTGIWSIGFKDTVQLVITMAVVLTYCYLVVKQLASVDGFVGIALYVIKKFLDVIEENNGGNAK